MLLVDERASVCPSVKELIVKSRCQQLSNKLFINTTLLHGD